jgi:hypothetical protein
MGFSAKTCSAPVVKSKMRKIGVKNFFMWPYLLGWGYNNELHF